MQAWTVHNFGQYQEQLLLEARDLPQVTGSGALNKLKASGIRGVYDCPAE